MFKFVRITSRGSVTKKVKLDRKGKLVKEPAADLNLGQFETVAVENLEQLGTALMSATHRQCFMYGQFGGAASGVLVSQGKKANDERYKDAFTRTRSMVNWSEQGGVLFLDYDPPKTGTAFTAEELVVNLRRACPFLRKVKMLWRPSSSSNVYNQATGEELTGIRGQRLYVLVPDATQIPRIGRVIYERSWLAGFGYYEIGGAGQMLERGLFDAAVWQPERQDFVGGMVCTPPLAQRELTTRTTRGEVEFLDPATVPDLTEVEMREVLTLKRRARGENEERSLVVKEAYIARRAAEIAADLMVGTPLDQHEAVLAQAVKTVVAALDGGVLKGDFPLRHSSGQEVPVAELLADKDTWHNARFFEPIEPGYGNDCRIAWACLTGPKPYIYSHAHGGKRYLLTD